MLRPGPMTEEAANLTVAIIANVQGLYLPDRGYGCLIIA
jgi:hypothetical protein